MKKSLAIITTFLILMFCVQLAEGWFVMKADLQSQAAVRGTQQQVAQDHKDNTNLITLLVDLNKAAYTISGDGDLEIVATRNEMCANEETLAASLSQILHNPTIIARVKHQCAIPFQAPTININAQGHINNKTGLPPGLGAGKFKPKAKS